MTTSSKIATSKLTTQILIAMGLGTVCGLTIKMLPSDFFLSSFLVDNILNSGGIIFTNLIKMLVVPLVLVSLICGICNLEDIKKIGDIGFKTIILFIFSTIVAITLAIIITSVLNIGHGMQFPTLMPIKTQDMPSLQQFVLDIFPSNPFQALTSGNILQIIVFALLLGFAINLSGEAGKRITSLMNDFNTIVMKAIMLIMLVMPYGVFCLMAFLFAKLGFGLILQLLNYFLTVILVLVIHTIVVYSTMLKVFAKLSPLQFFKKFYNVMLFAFSVSSSNATLPLALETTEHKLGVDNTITSFVLSLGINMNKNGTAIMQGVATIFIAHAYNIDLGLVGKLMVILTATLASISTAGAPSVGILALAMVLKQVGLPVEGIAVILSIDRFLDMLRTAVNVAGNAVIACVISKQEHKLNLLTYNSPQ
jgi:Na+/H+-dicarboxylate symporter